MFVVVASIIYCWNKQYFNSFNATGLFLYPLETLQNLLFSGVFRGYRKRSEAWNGLRRFRCAMSVEDNGVDFSYYMVK